MLFIFEIIINRTRFPLWLKFSEETFPWVSIYDYIRLFPISALVKFQRQGGFKGKICYQNKHVCTFIRFNVTRRCTIKRHGLYLGWKLFIFVNRNYHQSAWASSWRHQLQENINVKVDNPIQSNVNATFAWTREATGNCLWHVL